LAKMTPAGLSRLSKVYQAHFALDDNEFLRLAV